MADSFHPQDIADAFVHQYYVILNKCPENVHKFYKEGSILGWPGTDGVVTPVTTLSGINEKIMSSNCKNCSAEVNTIDAQESVDGGIIVAVTGSMTGADDSKRDFSQTFFLAKQENGFFALNDILRFFNHAPSVESAVSGNIPSVNTKASVENGKVEEKVDIPVSKTTAVSSAKVPSVVAPASNNTSPKISYASMVAKETTATSPKKVVVTANVHNKQPNASSTAQAPVVPIADGAAVKVSTPSGSVPKALAPSSKAAPKSPLLPLPLPRGNTAPNTSASAEARGIYIGRLPYDITKQGIVEVVKQFGPVRKNSETIQIRRHEDGFCCGFVEFESADSARRAVEAHHIKFGDKEAYITYKRSSLGRGNNEGRARSPTRGGFRSGNRNGADQNKGGQVRGPRLSKSPVGGRGQQSRDRLN